VSYRSVVVIQARMGSSRLPGKVLMPLNGIPVLEHVVERCRRSRADHVVVATSTSPADDVLAAWCAGMDYRYLRGPEDDVLSRYVMAARAANADIVIRVTGDCPAIEQSLIDTVIDALIHTGVDYLHVKAESKYPDAYPRGVNTEAFWRSTLNRFDANAAQPRHREHVTLQVEEDPQYTMLRLPAPPHLARPSYRLTLDTPQDYAMLSRLFSECPVTFDTPIDAIVRFLDAHPHIARLNADVEQKPA
jgi:spore coat polysaccharide biosynthesis protein SpsF